MQPYPVVVGRRLVYKIKLLIRLEVQMIELLEPLVLDFSRSGLVVLMVVLQLLVLHLVLQRFVSDPLSALGEHQISQLLVADGGLGSFIDQLLGGDLVLP